MLTKKGNQHHSSSVQFSHLIMSNSLRPHESQHARPPCPSPTPGVHSDSSPSSLWCHPAISSSVILFSPCPHPPSIRLFSLLKMQILIFPWSVHAQLCGTSWTISLPGFFVYEISQAGILSRLSFPAPAVVGSSWPMDQPRSLASPALAGGFFITEPPEKPSPGLRNKQ